MDLQTIYDSNRSTIIGSEIEYVKNIQKELILNYTLDKKILRENESTKHIDQKIINSFNYYVKKSEPEINFINKNTPSLSSIKIINGNDYLLNNIDKEKISFNSLYYNKNLMTEKISKYHNTFFEHQSTVGYPIKEHMTFSFFRQTQSTMIFFNFSSFHIFIYIS